tara:strand:- start:342 stop:539 length:198 start_codon:yes stop_codon:yes gene_type:complete
VPASGLIKENNLFLMYSKRSMKKIINNNPEIDTKKIDIRKNKFIPETKIKINQVSPVKSVCPISG